MRLNQITDNPGAHKARMRVGRGIGSGKGKTSGRGVKGQKARTGVSVKGFEGGQMPIHRRLPKRGFNQPFQPVFREVNLGRLQVAIDAGKLDAKAPIDAAVLGKAGIIGKPRDGVRLLGKGELKVAITITVAGASKSAVEAVEKAGGKVNVIVPREPANQVAQRAKNEAKKKAAQAKG